MGWWFISMEASRLLFLSGDFITALVGDLGNVPDSSDMFTILSTSAAMRWETDLKKLVGKVSKQHVEEFKFWEFLTSSWAPLSLLQVFPNVELLVIKKICFPWFNNFTFEKGCKVIALVERSSDVNCDGGVSSRQLRKGVYTSVYMSTDDFIEKDGPASHISAIKVWSASLWIS